MSGYGWTEADLARHLKQFGVNGPNEPPMAMALPPKANKYHARRTQSNAGFWHDSATEARRFDDLALAMQAGAIRDLLPHPSYGLFAMNGERIGRITFDAGYVEDGRYVVEDTKSPATAKATAYRQRLRIFQRCYPHITVREHIPSK